MAYERFEQRRRRTDDQPMITVLKGGQLGINKMCVELFFKDFKFAEMYFDKERKKIGIRPTNEKTKYANAVRRLKEGKLGSISAIEFLKHYGVKHEKSTAYPVIWNETERLLEISLK